MCVLLLTVAGFEIQRVKYTELEIIKGSALMPVYKIAWHIKCLAGFPYALMFQCQYDTLWLGSYLEFYRLFTQ